MDNNFKNKEAIKRIIINGDLNNVERRKYVNGLSKELNELALNAIKHILETIELNSCDIEKILQETKKFVQTK